MDRPSEDVPSETSSCAVAAAAAAAASTESDGNSQQSSSGNKIRFRLSGASRKKQAAASAFGEDDDADDADASVDAADCASAGEEAKKRRVECNTIVEHDPGPAVSDTPPHPMSSETVQLLLQDDANVGGWRVKLYRLNVDGSWDDCGTGRIHCVPRAEPSRPDAQHDTDHSHATAGTDDWAAADTPASSGSAGAWKAFERIPRNATLTVQQQRKLAAALDDAIHRDLGNPIFFMHAETPTQDTTAQQQQQQPPNLLNHSTHGGPRVLLRARVLLWETYQRQGDSIITWCEPAPEHSAPNANNTSDARNTHSHYPLNHTGPQDETCSYNGVDLALSFQDNAGCIDIWHNISTVQRRANDILKRNNGFLYESVDGRRIPFLKTWPSLQHATTTMETTQTTTQQQKHNSQGTANHNIQTHSNSIQTHFNHTPLTATSTTTTTTALTHTHPSLTHSYEQDKIQSSAVAMAVAAAAAAYGSLPRAGENNTNGQKLINYHTGNMNNFANYSMPLPSPPSFHHLEDIADLLVSVQSMTQREHMAAFIAKADCAYIHSLCALFPSAETRDDFQALATLASIIKAIVLLNDPDIIECIVSDGQLFEKCCCCLEYDPDLRDKANHRWFIRHRLKFRTVIFMEDAELISNIHISFRVTYLRDTLLRPTMDESCLSTLASLLTFTHTNVLKGVICAPQNPPITDEAMNRTTYDHRDHAAAHDTRFSPHSYLVRVLRLLGTEIKLIRKMEWAMDDYEGVVNNLETQSVRSQNSSDDDRRQEIQRDTLFASWEQHLAPQDDSLESRKIRRRGCVAFLRELFVMVRTSLQQSDKDDFYAMIVLLDVYLEETSPSETVNLLSLMGALLSDPTADISERGICLEILSTIAMHHASLIRQHCLDVFTSSRENKTGDDGASQMIVIPRPQPNDSRQILFYSHHNDLLMALLFVMAVESDAGVMLQTAELMRIIMDTEMINDHSLLGTGILDNEEDELLCGIGSFHGESHTSGGPHIGSSEQNSFLKMFYDHYVLWLVAPFQNSVFITKRALPFDFILYNKDGTVRKNQKLENLMTVSSTNFKSIPFLRPIPLCSIRASFSIELLSFCVRAHCYRMKFYVIRARVLSHVLKFLRPESKASPSGERCVKLAALRFLRSILAVKDEFYNRHIVQHNLFAPVFEAFRTNPIGDNLVASSIVEMCDFITKEDIKSLLEYIVTKHLHQPRVKTTDESSSLEDVAMPYVDTLTRLRRQFEESSYHSKDVKAACSKTIGDDKVAMRSLKLFNEKAMEDQRKFVEHDEEESYFNDDDT